MPSIKSHRKTTLCIILNKKIPYHTQPLYIIFHKLTGCIKDYDGNKYMTLIFSEEKEKDMLEKIKKKFNKIKYLIIDNNNK